jgi:dTDP-4-dehydrorhamnose reductase
MGDIRLVGHTAIEMGSSQCDITNGEQVHRVMRDTNVDIVINAAAYTAVDGAESDSELAFAVNGDGPAHLARNCRKIGVPLVHVSSDYVFNGTTTRPYRPSDAIDPLGAYGHSKAVGEANIRNLLTEHVIVRTSWLFGLQGKNFVKTMLAIGKNQAELQVVDDQIGSPTYAGDLAKALISIAEHVVRDKAGWGTYHYCNQGAVTWYAFARRIFTLARQHDLFAVRDIQPILTHQYPLPAPRPPYSVLDCVSTETTFGIARRPWEEALAEMISSIYQDDA